MGLWADEMVDAEYERVLEFNLSSVVVTWLVLQSASTVAYHGPG